MKDEFDVIWIGTGQATMTIVPRLLSAGKTVAVIEGGEFGGTCVNDGCTPTKTLVAAARALFQARRGNEFGFQIDGLKIDFPKLMQPQKEGRKNSSQGIEGYLKKQENCTVFHGYATFTGTHSVTVGEHVLNGKCIVINAGTRPRDPNIPGSDTVPWLNNRSLLDLDVLPEHLAVVGGSYIGLEFAQIFRRFGSRVTVFERGSRLLAREDQDVSNIAEDVLKDEGIDVLYNTTIDEIQLSSSENVGERGVTVHYRQAEEFTKKQSASHILFGIGRISNADRLDLLRAGVEVDSRGYIHVNEVMQTNLEHVYAIGDINGQGAFTHTSVNDGEIFWDHYSRTHQLSAGDIKWDRKLDDRTLIYSMFLDPPFSRVGINEEEARELQKKGEDISMAVMPMSSISRAKEKKETKGVVKVFIDNKTEKILGATIFGTGGDEVIGIFATLIQTHSSYKVLRRTVFPHPTVGELMPWVLDRKKPLNECP
jgi:pyruvate/2-oxoglutarate dehydrogenase complex dihydrolipoamide dehydrogenase (E3) component